MSWKIRHEGSPRSIEGLTLAQVIEGLQDGLWEPTDEVMGPGESRWLAIESHPQLAEAALDLEPPPAKVSEDETRLDMNPLIDVALVLLIFFILTTTYAAIQKVLPLPEYSQRDIKDPLRIARHVNTDVMIKVTAHRGQDGSPDLQIEQKPVKLDALVPELQRYVRDSHKTQMLLDAHGVDWGTVVTILDAAKAAGIERALFLKSKPGTPAPG